MLERLEMQERKEGKAVAARAKVSECRGEENMCFFRKT